MSNHGIEIKSTDKKFYDSPDVGPNCICSRCGKPILSGVPIRCWPDGIGKDPEKNFEWRFHPECLGIKTSNSMDGYDDDIGMI